MGREEKEGGRKKEGKGEVREERDHGLEERRRTQGTLLEAERSEIRKRKAEGKRRNKEAR